MNPTPQERHIQDKWERLLDPSYALCKEDVIWMLDYIAKNVTEENESLLALSQSRLLTNFRSFAEVAMMLIKRHSGPHQEQNRLKERIAEAAYGLTPNECTNDAGEHADSAD